MTPAGAVSIFAGTSGVSGAKDGTGTAAQFNNPCGLGIDKSDNIYVADYANATVRKITPAGVVTTLAGKAGTFGYQDGAGPAATFEKPFGLTLDSSGNIFVSDRGAHTVRKITSTGVVTTFAGTQGVSGTLDGTGAAAQFVTPLGLTIDTSNNIYVAEGAGGSTIRKITSGAVVTTLAGSPGVTGSLDGTGSAARFNDPQGVGVDTSGNVYVADRDNHKFRKITPAGVVTTIAGSGPTPTAAYVAKTGTVYMGDSGDTTIRAIAPPSNVVTNVAGTLNTPGSRAGSNQIALFNYPYAMAVDKSGNIYVADPSNNTISKITPDGFSTTIAGTAGVNGSKDGIGPAAQFNSPCGLAVGSSGNVYVADSANSTIRKITPDGTVSTIAGTAQTPGFTDATGAAARFGTPVGMAIDSTGNIYVADQNYSTIRKITPALVVSTFAGTAGVFGATDGTGPSATFDSPTGLAIDTNNNLYVTDPGSETVRKISPSKFVTTIAGQAYVPGAQDSTYGPYATFNGPIGIAVDPAGNVFVADSNNSTVRFITPAGEVSTLAGTAGVVGTADGHGPDAQFNYAAGIAVDAKYNIYIADSTNSTIRKGILDPFIILAGPPNDRVTFNNSFHPYSATTYPPNLFIPTITYTQTGGNTFDNPTMQGVPFDQGTYTVEATSTDPAYPNVAPVSAQLIIDNAQSSSSLAPSLPSVWVVGATYTFPLFVYSSSDGFSHQISYNALSSNVNISTDFNTSTVSITVTGPGEVKIEVTVLGAPNFDPAPPVDSGGSTSYDVPINLIDLSAVYDGNSHPVDWTTNPTVLHDDVSVTYTDRKSHTTSTAPSAAGSYAIKALLTDPDDLYTGSGAATMTISGPPTIVTSPTSTTVASGTVVIFTADADGYPVPTVKWQVSTDGGTTFSDIAGQTQTSLSVTATTSGNRYRAVFTNPAAPNGVPTASALLSLLTGTISQTLTFPTITPKTVGASFPLNATASSGLPVYYTTFGPATVSGNTATVTAVGSVSIRVHQDGNATYAAAPSVAQTFSVTSSTQSQTITFPAIANRSYTTTAFTLGATASSGLAVSYSVTSGPATVSGNSLTITGVGTITVQATQAGNTSYTAAPPVSQSFTVSKASQTLTFPTIPTETAGTSFPLNGSASSGLPVYYTTNGPITVSGNTATVTAAGTAMIRIHQDGNANYAAATTILQTFTVTASAVTSQTITFPAIANRAYTTTAFTLGATASSGLAVSYSVTSGPATVSGNSVTITGVGTITVQATQAGNTSYTAAPPVSQSFTVSKASQTLTFPTIATETAGTSFPLNGSASSGLPVYYTTNGPITVSGNTATVTAAGTAMIRIHQDGNANYAAATTILQTFTVTNAP